MDKIKNLTLIKIAFLFVVFCNAFVDVTHKVLLQNIAFKVFDGSTQVVWISIINSLIIIPFILLFTLSGFLSDKYDKKNILVYGAVSSFLLSILMIISYLSGNFYFAMGSLVLLAIQSAVYSPAKFGIIIDIYGRKNLASGNAFLQAISMMAILFSIASASIVFEFFYNNNNLQTLTTKEELLSAILPLTYYIVPFAFLEMLVSFLFLKNISTSYNKNKDLTLNKKELFQGKLLQNNMKILTSNNAIFLSVIGLSVFWGISQSTMAVFPSFAKMYLGISDVSIINGVIGASGIGIAIGSIMYSKISKYYIEVGTIPLAAFGMALTLYISTLVASPILLAIIFLFFGFFGGMFIVPLNALIQFNAKKKVLGTILAGNNWFHSVSMFLMLGMTTIVSYYGFDPLKTIYLILLITLAGTMYTIYQLPQSLILLFLKTIVGMKYKLEVNGITNIPQTGGVLLLGNHISWIDWAVVLMAVPKEVRFVMDKTIYSKWYIKWIFRMFNAIPISNASSKTTIKIIAKQLDEGNIVVIFPEGSITRNGHLGEFKKGFEKILQLTSTDVKVVPFYIRGLWESMFSRANQKFKKSNRTNSVTISFARYMKKENANIISVKKQIINLSTKSWQEHIKNLKPLNETIFNRLKELKNNMIFTDSTGLELSGHKFLTASIVFKNLLKKQIENQNVGILLPSSTAGAFINYSVLLMGKTAVNLNYTSQIETLKYCISKAQIKSIITSRKFIEKLELRGIDLKEAFEDVELIYLEDLRQNISKAKSLSVFLSVKILPSFLSKLIHLTKTKKDDTVLILFSSGSEGTPKGIELSGDNILGNAQQIANIINVNDEDIILGSLPLFHAFGIVVTTYLPLIEGIRCVAHPDPTDGLAIAKLISSYKVTIMCGTSTFFRLYTKNQKIHSLMFESLRLVVSGAEKLREDVRIEFKKRFAKDILEGFGTTETSPVATCNLPDVLSPDFSIQKGQKAGTVGMAIPGTTIKVVDPVTFKELETNEEGMILISGIQVMKSYLDDEERTKKALKVINAKTYYITGDKGKLDEDGFLTIVDRYSRFAKIGGEMISLGAIEELISKFIESTYNLIDFLFTSLEDEKNGEKIVLLIPHANKAFIQALQ